jgi:hypothetical protein
VLLNKNDRLFERLFEEFDQINQYQHWLNQNYKRKLIKYYKEQNKMEPI